MRILLAAAAVAAMVLGAPVAASADTAVQVRLFALNDSGASGTATLTALPNGDLKVSIRSTHLVPDVPHAQHLHGSTTGMDFHCPDPSADRDHDGYVTTEEGLPAYGDIFVSLTTRGDTSRASGLAMDRMPVADARGSLAYDRTIPADELPPGTVEHLKDLHIVEHGIDANANHRYDVAGLGESTFAAAAGLSGIPEEATDPAVCGMVSGAAAGSVPVGGVAAGDGSARGRGTFGYGYGALVVVVIGGVVLFARRRSFVLPRGGSFAGGASSGGASSGGAFPGDAFSGGAFPGDASSGGAFPGGPSSGGGR
ncbi:hypothetical protein GCM10010168_33330 [Actinoplanes ianthinogenes]|uniref:hypothetical protein n=1 Tax=Actinoplanes ianthinogenes TaxID=122358 RepID=UPI001670EBD5|nr:hypothetical protein [Actinoplanes ianthinogenes]GGR12893.1 hypothetical protein GCM10010168_33330 [Actinoplanes ianthinogenes]